MLGFHGKFLSWWSRQIWALIHERKDTCVNMTGIIWRQGLNVSEADWSKGLHGYYPSAYNRKMLGPILASLLMSSFFSCRGVFLVTPYHQSFLWFSFIAFTTVLNVFICLPIRLCILWGQDPCFIHFCLMPKKKLPSTELNREGRLYWRLLQ